MIVKCYQYPLLQYRSFKNHCVISPCLARFGSADYVVSRVAQKSAQFHSKHLIEVEAHSGLYCVNWGNIRVKNGMPGVFQSSLNIIPGQFWIAAQQ